MQVYMEVSTACVQIHVHTWISIYVLMCKHIMHLYIYIYIHIFIYTCRYTSISVFWGSNVELKGGSTLLLRPEIQSAPKGRDAFFRSRAESQPAVSAVPPGVDVTTSATRTQKPESANFGYLQDEAVQ